MSISMAARHPCSNSTYKKLYLLLYMQMSFPGKNLCLQRKHSLRKAVPAGRRGERESQRAGGEGKWVGLQGIETNGLGEHEGWKSGEMGRFWRMQRENGGERKGSGGGLWRERHMMFKKRSVVCMGGME